jgi:hypothetical protein
MDGAVPELARWGQGPFYLMRWSPKEKRDDVAARLASGLSHMARCAPRSRIFVLCHSAAGIIGSFAAAKVRVPGGHERVFILTVGAQLAGFLSRPVSPDGGQQDNTFLDLGTEIQGYPEPALGVRVVHLRTQAPADLSMTRWPLSHPPNEPNHGVPRARQIDLPENLTHSGALIYVVRAVIDGSVEQWLK